LHIDETSHYSKGKLGWCWVFANNEASLIKLADTRGVKFLGSVNKISCEPNVFLILAVYAFYASSV
jgi:transposase